jgi:hypothetical protein
MICNSTIRILSIAAASCASPLLAGSAPPVPATPPPADSPLSFYGGKLVFDVHERMRFEYRENNFDFDNSIDSLTDDSWLLQRFRIGMKWTPLPWFSLYVQGQDTREYDSDRPDIIGTMGAEGDDQFDLRQGYIRLGDPKAFSLTAGRQVMLYGDERVIGPLDWANQGRTFDVIKLRYEGKGWWVDAFASSVVTFRDEKFNESDWLSDSDTRDQTFSGVYFSTTLWGPQTTDLYVLQLHEENADDTDFLSFGARVKADVKKTGGWDYEMEAVVQTGEVKDRDLSAWAIHAGIGYVWLQHPWKPRVFAEYNHGTGDENATDGDTETFQNLFPTNHKFYGYMDFFSWQNIHNPAISFSVAPTKDLTLRADGHLFWLADTGDAWYRANGVTMVRPINSSADSYVGAEIDFTAIWKPKKWLTVQAGYSHFFAGDYAEATGPSDDADFVYTSAAIDF